MDIRKLFLITGLSIFGSGCASINNQSPLEHWKTFILEIVLINSFIINSI